MKVRLDFPFAGVLLIIAHLVGETLTYEPVGHSLLYNNQWVGSFGAILIPTLTIWQFVTSGLYFFLFYISKSMQLNFMVILCIINFPNSSAMYDSGSCERDEGIRLTTRKSRPTTKTAQNH